MAPGRLMQDFGGKIVFWGGGCDTQHMLPLGSTVEIKEHVARNIRIFGGGSGGYVFNQVHNIQQDVPVENIETMYQAAYEFGSR
jgi:uroporphyrinogen decarboxylase